MRAIILVDHGSRREKANAKLEAVAAELAARRPRTIVEPAHMELAEPSIAAAFAKAVARGATEIVVHPYFLSPGRHVREDIPRLCSEAAAAHADLKWRLTGATGESPSILDAILERIDASEKRSG